MALPYGKSKSCPHFWSVLPKECPTATHSNTWAHENMIRIYTICTVNICHENLTSGVQKLPSPTVCLACSKLLHIISFLLNVFLFNMNRVEIIDDIYRHTKMTVYTLKETIYAALLLVLLSCLLVLLKFPISHFHKQILHIYFNPWSY